MTLTENGSRLIAAWQHTENSLNPPGYFVGMNGPGLYEMHLYTAIEVFPDPTKRSQDMNILICVAPDTDLGILRRDLPESIELEEHGMARVDVCQPKNPKLRVRFKIITHGDNYGEEQISNFLKKAQYEHL